MLIAHVIDAVLQLKDQFSAQLKNISKGLSDFQKQTKYVASDMKKVGKATENIGKGLMAHVTAPIVATSTVAAKSAMDFKENIANIDTLLDDHSHLKSYEQQVLNISKSTGMSLKTVSEGMYTAVSSLGDGGKETQEIFKTMTNAAKAGGAEVNDSVALISAAMKGYGSVSNETAKKISDLAFQTAKLGVTTFPEMAKSMQPLFPLAKNLNFSYEELFGTMATLTGVTGNTSEVSTQLKMVFSNMMKPTKEMSALMQKYGFSNAQAMIKSKGLAGTIDILKKETGGQADKMGKLFSSTEAVTAIMALTGANYDDLIRKTKEMEKASGSTDKALRKVSSTTKDRFNKAINNLKVSLTELGVVLLPIVTQVSDAITKVATKFGSLSKKQQEGIVKFVLFAATLGPVIFAIGRTTVGISKTIKSINNLQKGIKKAGGIMKYFTSPGHKAVLIMTALALVAILIITHWDKVSACFNKVSKGISKATGLSQKSIGKFIIGTITGLTTLLSVGNIFGKGFGGGFRLLNKIIKGSGKGITGTFKLIKKGILKSFSGIGKSIRASGKGITTAFKFIGKGSIKAFKGISKGVNMASKGIGKGFKLILKIASNTARGIISVSTRVFTFLAANPVIAIIMAIIAVCVLLYNAWTHNWGGIQEKTHTVIDFCKQKINSIKETFSAVKSKCSEFANSIKQMWDNIRNFLANPIKGTINLVKNITGGGKVDGKNALGTSYWGGGLSVVGEHGPEIVEMPSGSKVYDNKDSKRMVGKGGDTKVIFTGNIHVRKESDIDAIANAIVKKLEIQQLNMA
ncbi:phage tail tape measure protein [Clostridium niameyense]|uniref:Phage tail tape measure protein n=1 Tax=Clostridium niameyense TaxID=1622073 RepID=A0A6M0REN8_9CLOT|nr:phage tail tape measure protein [Clostridium niameyense]NEZ47958.1 phage tail tape measure protein [Clostridium niameyense]